MITRIFFNGARDYLLGAYQRTRKVALREIPTGQQIIFSIDEFPVGEFKNGDVVRYKTPDGIQYARVISPREYQRMTGDSSAHNRTKSGRSVCLELDNNQFTILEAYLLFKVQDPRKEIEGVGKRASDEISEIERRRDSSISLLEQALTNS